MNATLSSRGQLVIPESIREKARLRQGDKVDIGYADGLVVLRKRHPLSSSLVRAMLAGGDALPQATPDDEREVAGVVAAVRKSRRRGKATS
jgi:AbrB family looped-hinge helix DNA binding protein